MTGESTITSLLSSSQVNASYVAGICAIGAAVVAAKALNKSKELEARLNGSLKEFESVSTLARELIKSELDFEKSSLNEASEALQKARTAASSFVRSVFDGTDTGEEVREFLSSRTDWSSHRAKRLEISDNT